MYIWNIHDRGNIVLFLRRMLILCFSVLKSKDQVNLQHFDYII